MSARYSLPVKLLKKTYRRFRPVPRSPWTAGHVNDICAVNLVPPQKLIHFFEDCLLLLKQIKGDEIGDYLEFGVFNGNSIGSMVLARKAIGMPSMRLFADSGRSCAAFRFNAAHDSGMKLRRIPG
jgi:hypothetical protein